MIELTQVKSTDKLGQLQGILNTAFSEIQSDQPFIGVCQNISMNAYAGNNLVSAITASALVNQKLYALCFPESNGVFIAKVFGRIMFSPSSSVAPMRVEIDVPAVKLPTRDAVVSTFVSPSHLGLAPTGSDTVAQVGCAKLLKSTANTNPLILNATIEQHDSTCNIHLVSTGGIFSLEAAPYTIYL